jgi:DNA-binding protein HU-beta
MKVTKKELSERVAVSMDTSNKKAAESVNAVLQEIINCIEKGEEVTLLGFGRFTVMDRKERRGRNPNTGEEIVIPAKKVLKFCPSKTLEWGSSVGE